MSSFSFDSIITAYAFFGALETGLIYGLVALGVFISFRLLRFPDLTVDGSFPLGAAVAAALIVNHGVDPFLATAAAAAAGFAAGMVTAFLSVKLRIMDLLASIIVMTALYSVNLRVMGKKANVYILDEPQIFGVIQAHLGSMLSDTHGRLLIILLIVILVKILIDWFFSTQIGLSIRATGTNTRMAKAQGIATDRMMILGLAISNALVGFAGGLYAQANSFSDSTLGIGTIVTGLAAVIIGERILPARRIFWATLAVIIGAVLYRLFIAIALNAQILGLDSSDLNLVTGVLITIALIIPLMREKGARYLNRLRIIPKKNESEVSSVPVEEEK